MHVDFCCKIFNVQTCVKVEFVSLHGSNNLLLILGFDGFGFGGLRAFELGC